MINRTIVIAFKVRVSRIWPQGGGNVFSMEISENTYNSICTLPTTLILSSNS